MIEPRRITEDEAGNLSSYISSVIGANRGFVLLVVDCSGEHDADVSPEVISNLSEADMVVTILEAAMDTVNEGESEEFSTGGST